MHIHRGLCFESYFDRYRVEAVRGDVVDLTNVTTGATGIVSTRAFVEMHVRRAKARGERKAG